MNPLRTLFDKFTTPKPSWERMMAVRRAMGQPGEEEVLARYLKKYGIEHCGVKGGGQFLHSAALNGHTRLVEMLLDAGMDIHERDGTSTPLYHAIIGSKGNTQTVELLLDRGADINEHGGAGWQPLHSAAGFDNPEVFMLLLRRGADVNGVNNEGVTPLMHAATCGRKGMVGLLVKYGANVAAQDKNGRTALHYAAHGQQETIYKFLKRQQSPQQIVQKGALRTVTVMKPIKLKALN